MARRESIIIATQMDITLYSINIDEKLESFYAEALKILPPERVEKALRYRFEKDRRLSLAAGMLIREATGGKEIKLEADGKPYAEGGPFFNVSHSGSMVICAAGTCPVGCDIEEVKKDTEKIAKRFFTREEQEYIEESGNREEAFAEIWTLKESFMKAVGLGLSLPMTEFSILMGNPVKVIHSVNNKKYSCARVERFLPYRCAVCAETEEEINILYL